MSTTCGGTWTTGNATTATCGKPAGHDGLHQDGQAFSNAATIRPALRKPAALFGSLTFTERRQLVAKLRSGVGQCRYEAHHLRTPHAVAYKGQQRIDYLNMIDDVQALVDDVQAIDLARGL